MPQICHDVAVRIFAEEEEGWDWIDGMKLCLEDPNAIYDYVIRLVERVGADGLRLFVKPEPTPIERVGDDLIVLDEEGGKRIGKIDLHGGGHIVLGQDVCFKVSLKRYGGWGYAHLLENIVPIMRAEGFSHTDIDTLLIANPRRVFCREG